MKCANVIVTARRGPGHSCRLDGVSSPLQHDRARRTTLHPWQSSAACHKGLPNSVALCSILGLLGINSGILRPPLYRVSGGFVNPRRTLPAENHDRHVGVEVRIGLDSLVGFGVQRHVLEDRDPLLAAYLLLEIGDGEESDVGSVVPAEAVGGVRLRVRPSDLLAELLVRHVGKTDDPAAANAEHVVEHAGDVHHRLQRAGEDDKIELPVSKLVGHGSVGMDDVQPAVARSREWPARPS